MRLTRLSPRRTCLIVCLVIYACGVFEYHVRATANKIFGNMSYLTDCPYIAEKVTLVNGQRTIWNCRLHVSMHYQGQYVYGDFNRDGLTDAAVVIGESQGGSDDSRLLAFLISDGTQLVHRQSEYLGNSAIVKSLKEHDGKIITDMFEHQEGDCMAGPTKRVKNVYAYVSAN